MFRSQASNVKIRNGPHLELRHEQTSGRLNISEDRPFIEYIKSYTRLCTLNQSLSRQLTDIPL
jgi:hypothetical protein